MEQKKTLQTMIEQDLAYSEQIWKQFSYDKDEMEALFRRLLGRYIDKINGFAEDIEVLSGYEKSGEKAEVYRKNVSLLLDRMKLFQENGCSNEGLFELYLKREKDTTKVELDITKVRLQIGMMQEISVTEKEEIMEKLCGIEEICSLPLPRRKKWDRLREYVVWVSGKNDKIAMKLLPLFLKIK